MSVRSIAKPDTGKVVYLLAGLFVVPMVLARFGKKA